MINAASIATSLLALSAAVSAHTVSLSWDAVPDVDGYRVLWSEQDGDWTNSVEVGSNTFATLNIEVIGKPVFYSVVAYKDDLQGAPADSVKTFALEIEMQHTSDWQTFQSLEKVFFFTVGGQGFFPLKFNQYYDR